MELEENEKSNSGVFMDSFIDDLADLSKFLVRREGSCFSGK